MTFSICCMKTKKDTTLVTSKKLVLICVQDYRLSLFEGCVMEEVILYKIRCTS